MRLCKNHRRRQRGTAYVLVLAITSILIVLGIAATQIARGEIERNDLEQDQAKARIAAQYAMDYIHKLRNGDVTWRANVVNAQWRSFMNYNGVAIYSAYIDQIDGDMANDSGQPFLLYTAAVSGDSRRVYRVEMISDDAGNLTRNDETFEQIPFDEL